MMKLKRNILTKLPVYFADVECRRLLGPGEESCHQQVTHKLYTIELISSSVRFQGFVDLHHVSSNNVGKLAS